ncbi:acyltransferase [Cryobacterium sp. 1639]|uniref:acyltransferase family protein n=1 Tax=Cryobacterium inferilacus TaxID=2866629 RepID=UPI001C73C662|nr:acyltransferase family protein [Cryobacterium sp. 1639]MBX0300985.1 acyltransferase [Cryobacterium sp. 1639]
MRAKRVDIQGLRALAVILVVVYHLWPGRITGGYVGVDVFFVISGFLITAHLLSEVERTGTVSLSKFWARRVRRLLPAAFTVLGASLAAAFVFLPKSLFEQALFEIGASAIYLQNWVLAGDSVDYLAADNKPSIVQHYWSLSVEEQFYIVWPLLIVGTVWVAAKVRRDRASSSNRHLIAVALLVVFGLSLVFSIYETARSQSSAYFITPTRAWEFAVGGLLVFVTSTVASALVRRAVSWLGVAAIVGSAFLFDAGTQFPGALALVPVLGAALVIWAGESDSQWSTTHVFRFAPIQFFGDVSYAVYLWHWPMIVLFPFVFGADLTFRSRVVLLLVTILLAAATKYLIEDPVLRAPARVRGRAPAFVFLAAGTAILVGITAFTTLRIDGDRQQFTAELASAIEQGDGCLGASAMDLANACESPHAVTDALDAGFAAKDVYWNSGVAETAPCAKRATGAPMGSCERGDLTDPVLTIALIGDSHAEHLVDPLVTYAESHQWRVLPLTKSGCSGLETREAEQMSPSNAQEKKAQECIEWGESVRAEMAERTDVDVVAFSNRSKTKAVTATQAASEWQLIMSSGKTVVSIRDVPGMPVGVDAPECVETSQAREDPCSWKPGSEPDFMEEAARLSGAPLVDMTEFLCTDATCHAVTGDLVVYFDDNHLTYTFAQTLSPILGSKLQAAIEQH